MQKYVGGSQGNSACSGKQLSFMKAKPSPRKPAKRYSYLAIPFEVMLAIVMPLPPEFRGIYLAEDKANTITIAKDALAAGFKWIRTDNTADGSYAILEKERYD
jgi:hypothetical protein